MSVSERLPVGEYDDFPCGGEHSPWRGIVLSPEGESKTPIVGNDSPPWGEPLGEYDGLPHGGEDI